MGVKANRIERETSEAEGRKEQKKRREGRGGI